MFASLTVSSLHCTAVAAAARLGGPTKRAAAVRARAPRGGTASAFAEKLPSSSSSSSSAQSTFGGVALRTGGGRGALLLLLHTTATTTNNLHRRPAAATRMTTRAMASGFGGGNGSDGAGTGGDASASSGEEEKNNNSATTTWTGGSVASLETWLRTHGVDPSPFGAGSAKRVDELATEVECGEATLEVVDGAPRRSVRVLQLRILDESRRVLIEARQEWDCGRVRERGTPLSEKLLRGEDWREAAPRAVAEELGSALRPGYALEVDDSTLRRVAVERDSLSYPGLPSRYLMHSVEARIANGFPEVGKKKSEDEDENENDDGGGIGGGEEGFTSVEENSRGRLTATWVWRDDYPLEEGVEVNEW